MDKKPEVPINCFFQGCYNPAYEEEIHKGKEKCYRYNQLSPNDREAQQKILLELLGGMGNDVIITPPFWCDYVKGEPIPMIAKSQFDRIISAIASFLSSLSMK